MAVRPMAATVRTALKWWATLGVLLSVFLVVAISLPANAAPYGQGSFGKCNYDGCQQQPASPTIISSGDFKISINLNDNQTVPNSGYTVVIKLLSDPSVPLKQVEFYIDGKLVATVTPSSPTLVHWLWDSKLYPGSTVKIVATDINGNVITREFKIAISGTAEVPVETPSPLEAVHDTLVD